MKKIRLGGVIFAGCFLLGSNFAVAQKGVKAGLDLANLSTSADGGEEWKRAWLLRVGGFYGIRLFEKVSLQPELYFARKGATAVGSLLGRDLEIRTQLNYLELPVLFRRPVFEGDRIEIAAFGGGYGAVLLSANQTAVLDGDSRSEDIGDVMKRTDFGYTVGAEIVLPFLKKRTLLDFRISRGVQNIRDTTLVGGSTRNREIALALGYRF